MKVNIVFDGPPGPEAGRFVEVEDLDGRGVGIGEWVDYPEHDKEGWCALQIEVPDETVRR